MGLNASATCIKVLFMRFANVQRPAPLSLLLHFAKQYNSLLAYKCIVIIIRRPIIIIAMDGPIGPTHLSHIIFPLATRAP